MKTKLIIILYLILIHNYTFAQQKTKVDSIIAPRESRSFVVGIDVMNAGVGMFSDTKLYQGFLSTKISKKIEVVVDAGVSKNKYQKNGYNADASGAFVKVGATHILVQDNTNPYDSFYIGGKLAMSFYHQEYYKIPIRGMQSGDYYETLPKTKQNSYWIEASVGGRVELFQSNFFIDVQLQPRYLLFTTKQENIKPMIVPGFGRSSTGFNLGFLWAIAYRF